MEFENLLKLIQAVSDSELTAVDDLRGGDDTYVLAVGGCGQSSQEGAQDVADAVHDDAALELLVLRGNSPCRDTGGDGPLRNAGSVGACKADQEHVRGGHHQRSLEKRGDGIL